MKHIGVDGKRAGVKRGSHKKSTRLGKSFETPRGMIHKDHKMPRNSKRHRY